MYRLTLMALSGPYRKFVDLNVPSMEHARLVVFGYLDGSGYRNLRCVAHENWEWSYMATSPRGGRNVAFLSQMPDTDDTDA